MRKRFALLALVLWSVAFPASAQNTGLNERIKALSSVTKSGADYKLGPGDLIEVGVFGVESLRQTIRISATGLIKLPLLEPVEAAGLTAAELEARLKTMLEGEIVKNPQVSVFVKEYRSQQVLVLGAVRTPGQYTMTMQLKFVDVIAMAGGLDASAADEVSIQRKSDDGSEEILKVNLIELLEKGDLSLNIPLKGGDVVNVPERLATAAFVLGEVNHAGAFPLPRKQELRVSQLLAQAGGPMKTAKMKSGFLVRYSEQSGREQIPVNLDDILKGKKEDFVVRANDVIFVPGSKVRTLGYGALSSLPGSLVNLPFWLLP